MARARRPEARGDPPIAISSCSNFAARPAGVKLRARLPSRRVAAHNLPRHRLALSGRGRSAASRAGGRGPCWSHGAVRPRCAAAASTRSRPAHPASRHAHSRSQLSSLDRGPPSAAARLPAGDAMTVEHRERARTRRRRASAQGCKRSTAPCPCLTPHNLLPRLTVCAPAWRGARRSSAPPPAREPSRDLEMCGRTGCKVRETVQRR